MFSIESYEAVVSEATDRQVLVREHQLSIQRACHVVSLSRTAYHQPPLPARRRDAAVIAGLADAIRAVPALGLLELFDRLRVEAGRGPTSGWIVTTRVEGVASICEATLRSRHPNKVYTVSQILESVGE